MKNGSMLFRSYVQVSEDVKSRYRLHIRGPKSLKNANVGICTEMSHKRTPGYQFNIGTEPDPVRDVTWTNRQIRPTPPEMWRIDKM